MGNRDVALDLYRELEEAMRPLPGRIKNVNDENSPALKIIIEGLGKAVAALKTTIR